ncbi:MAG TPA: 2-amino-4-oxopentanoate thiolase subunit OrtA [Anaerovoracaceae bacterium]|nr:2-amino-4-oxopentanoate thiolase subunit OrtA [Anaerovoracaceae bacterium]
MVGKGSWVLISRTILKPGERAPHIPEDTLEVPLKMWIKGYLCDDAKLGDTVNVITRTGRKENGTLLEADPYYEHDYGRFIPELLVISSQVRDIVFGGEK